MVSLTLKDDWPPSRSRISLVGGPATFRPSSGVTLLPFWNLYKCAWEQASMVCVYCHNNRKQNRNVWREMHHMKSSPLKRQLQSPKISYFCRFSAEHSDFRLKLGSRKVTLVMGGSHLWWQAPCAATTKHASTHACRHTRSPYQSPFFMVFPFPFVFSHEINTHIRLFLSWIMSVCTRVSRTPGPFTWNNALKRVTGTSYFYFASAKHTSARAVFISVGSLGNRESYVNVKENDSNNIYSICSSCLHVLI